ncbi:hypothetical protein CC80DRAFT_495112 [Byssothecium circinans]|uniref:Endonuclease/exonuclease/phosphatase domain-containing protein n=1 Tax=Byssothecium circinans TaxID=147558 RepID=A0A6A5TJI0_9PLEO|nr:hypothetical protein CC80DRAFT_495112 [Byssothecium circinans]
MVSKSMLASLLQKQLSYTPEPQTYYTFSEEHQTWLPSPHSNPSEPSNPDPTLTTIPANDNKCSLSTLHLITWNIDFMASHPRARMASALQHLQDLTSSIPTSSALVVFLQEMMESEDSGAQGAKDLTQITEQEWVRQKFHVTDVDFKGWESPYGVVSLVDRRLDVKAVQRLRFVSEYQRSAISVDVGLAAVEGGRGEKGEKVLRLCNVHLDSSYGTMRPIQWKGLAQHLQISESVAASVVAGDCNANQKRDWTEPRDNGFRDAYLELGGEEGGEEGATWGFQSARNRWGRVRLDKVCFRGSVEVKSLWRIGVGVEVGDERARKELEEEGELPFVTDHYGLVAEIEVVGGLSMSA